MRRTLGFLDRLARSPAAVTAEDVAPLREAGLSDEAIEDAIYLCACYSVVDRLAGAFGFELPAEEELRRTSRFLLRVGYRV